MADAEAEVAQGIYVLWDELPLTPFSIFSGSWSHSDNSILFVDGLVCTARGLQTCAEWGDPQETRKPASHSKLP